MVFNMINNGISFLSIGNTIPCIIDIDASKVIEAVRLSGSLITPDILMYTHYLISNMKSIGTWQKCIAVYGFVGGAPESHKWNWKDLRDVDGAFRLTYSGNINHTANGVQGDGSTGFANTSINPSSQLELNDIHTSFYCNTNTLVNSGAEIGMLNEDINAIAIGAGFGTLGLSDIFGVSNRVSFINDNTIGYYIGNRTSPSSHKILKNGIVKNTSFSTNTATLPNGSITLLKTDSGNFSSKRLAFVSIGYSLTALQEVQQSAIVYNAQLILNRA